MRFLVTGATGFVGGAVARRLLGNGEDVHVFVRDRDAAAWLGRAGARVFTGTVGDPNEVVEAARGCDVLIHAAACASHRAAPRALQWVNIAGTENVLNAARYVGVERLVHISCADVTLTNQDRVHWDEDRDLTGRPHDAHARSKLEAEDLALCATTPQLETTALRPAILWGPGDTTTLPGVYRDAGRSGFRLVGSGDNLIATTYIELFVDAVLSAAEVDGVAGRAYYVVDGNFIDAKEFFGALCEAAGLSLPRPGPRFEVAHALAWMRQLVRAPGPWPTDVIRRGRSTVFNNQRSIHELELPASISMDEGMQAVADWVRQMGGVEQVAQLERAPASASSVDAQVAAAGGEA